MKRIVVLLAVVGLCQAVAFGQKKYEMVIEKTDGSEIAINVEDIVRTYFRERTDGNFTLSSYTVELKVGETKIVDITSGSGWYNTTTSNSGIVTVASSGSAISLTGKSVGTAEVSVTDVKYEVTRKIAVTVTGGTTLTSCPDSNHPHMIDLGLPSGTKWACCNVGASAPEQYGNYYAWGETQPKSVYYYDTYQYYQNGNWVNIGSDIAGTSYDAATANWGAPWRMPSKAQCEELINNTTSVWTTQNGVNGRRFTSSNGGTIFLPAAGGRWYGELDGAGSDGRYWSSTLGVSVPYGACGLYFYSGFVDWYYSLRYDGQSVRPVR